MVRHIQLSGPMGAMNSSARAFFNVIGRSFYRRLIPPLSMFLILAVLADATTNWTELRNQIASQEPISVAVLFTGIFLGWGTIAGHALRSAWRQPAIGFLLRQPMGLWRWAYSLFPSLLLAFTPLMCVWWLAPNPGQSVLHYVGFVGLLWPILLGASYGGAKGLCQVTVSTMLLAALMFTYRYFSFVALIAFVIAVAAMPLSLIALRYQQSPVQQFARQSLATNTPVGALFRRDLLCLWRLDRKALLGCLPLLGIAAPFMVAFRIQGGEGRRAIFLAACILFSVTVMPFYEILLRLKARLGTQLMRISWPVRYVQRTASLFGLALLIASPNALAIGIAGSSMGVSNGIRFLLFSFVALTSLCALFAATLRLHAASFGWSLWLLLIHCVIVTTVPAEMYGPIAILILVVMSFWTTHGLREFSEQSVISRND